MLQVSVARVFDPRLPSVSSQRPATAWAASQGLLGTFARMLKRPTCFDLAPESGKLVLLDISLPTTVAFRALRENGIKSAPLWSTDAREFVGLISVSDFLQIMFHVYGVVVAQAGPNPDPVQCDAIIKNLLDQPLAHWRETINPRIPHLVFVSPEDSVLEASAAMLQHNIHRVAILDPESHTLMYLMTHSVILTFMLRTMEGETCILIVVEMS